MKYVFIFAVFLVLLGLCSAASFNGKSSSLWSKLERLQNAKREDLLARRLQGLQRRHGGSGGGNGRNGGLPPSPLGILRHLCGIDDDEMSTDGAGDFVDDSICHFVLEITVMYNNQPGDIQKLLGEFSKREEKRFGCLVYFLRDEVEDPTGEVGMVLQGFNDEVCGDDPGDIIQYLEDAIDDIVPGAHQTRDASAIRSLLAQIEKLVKK